MPQVDWYVQGIEYGNCNCDYGCPCQFESLPTHGHCKGFEVVRIDKGHFGEVTQWPQCGADLRLAGPDFQRKWRDPDHH